MIHAHHSIFRRRATDLSHHRSVLRESFDRSLSEADVETLVRGQVVIALADTKAWIPWLREARLLLDNSESLRVRRRRVAADRDSLAIAYALHRLLLATALGMDAAAVPLYRDMRGAPRLAKLDLHTSLSHAGGHVAMAVSALGPIGVDIEPTERAAQMPPIASSVCSPSEAARLTGLDSPEYGRALLELWVRKEAMLKAAGIGLLREMNTFAVFETAGALDVTDRIPRTQLIALEDALCLAIAGPLPAAITTLRLQPPGDGATPPPGM